MGCRGFATNSRLRWGSVGHKPAARSDSGIAMRNPAAKDPDLTSGLCGFNPGRAHFQGNFVCLCLLAYVCLLVACFLLASACCCFVASFSSREAKLRSRAERHRYVPCLLYVSGTFPARLRYVSVTYLWCASPWPLPWASVKEASIREQS